MTPEQAYEKIKQTHNTEKGKNFILHLMRSFLPANKSTYLWDSKPGAKCSITGLSLIGKEQAFKVFMETFKDQFKHTLESYKAENVGDQLQTPSPVETALNGKVLGITCKKSDKLLSLVALEALQKFTIDQMLAGDKNVQYTVSQQRRADRPATPKTVDKQATVKVPEIKLASNKLGDFSNLQALKDQLEAAEKGQ